MIAKQNEVLKKRAISDLHLTKRLCSARIQPTFMTMTLSLTFCLGAKSLHLVSQQLSPSNSIVSREHRLSVLNRPASIILVIICDTLEVSAGLVNSCVEDLDVADLSAGLSTEVLVGEGVGLLGAAEIFALEELNISTLWLEHRGDGTLRPFIDLIVAAVSLARCLGAFLVLEDSGDTGAAWLVENSEHIIGLSWGDLDRLDGVVLSNALVVSERAGLLLRLIRIAVGVAAHSDGNL